MSYKDIAMDLEFVAEFIETQPFVAGVRFQRALAEAKKFAEAEEVAEEPAPQEGIC